METLYYTQDLKKKNCNVFHDLSSEWSVDHPLGVEMSTEGCQCIVSLLWNQGIPAAQFLVDVYSLVERELWGQLSRFRSHFHELFIP